MGDMGLDWNTILKEQADDSSAGAIPEGPYEITVVKAEGTRASTGSPMIKLTCDITEVGPFKGKRLWTNIVLKADNATAMRMSLRKLAGLGISNEWLAENNPTVDLIASKLAGASAVAKVTQRTWNGELRNEIDMFTRSGDGGSTPAPPQVSAPLPSPEAELPVEEPAPAPAPAPEAAPAPAATPEGDPF